MDRDGLGICGVNMRLIPYEYKHNARLMEIYKITEPWVEFHRAKFDAWFAGREGFVLVSSCGKIVGAITFTNYQPNSDITIHCSVLPEYQKRWLTKSIYKQVFDVPFVKLGLERCSGFIIDGCTPRGFHERLGFKYEGTLRRSIRVQGEYRDVHLYGMTKDERRW